MCVCVQCQRRALVEEECKAIINVIQVSLFGRDGEIDERARHTASSPSLSVVLWNNNRKHLCLFAGKRKAAAAAATTSTTTTNVDRERSREREGKKPEWIEARESFFVVVVCWWWCADIDESFSHLAVKGQVSRAFTILLVYPVEK